MNDFYEGNFGYFTYGCCGGPKNNGRFGFIDSKGKFRIGSNNMPCSKYERKRLLRAGPQAAASTKWHNLNWNCNEN